MRAKSLIRRRWAKLAVAALITAFAATSATGCAATSSSDQSDGGLGISISARRTADVKLAKGPVGVAAALNGRYVYVASDGNGRGSVAAIEVSSDRVVATIPIQGFVEAVAMSLDAKSVYVASDNSGSGGSGLLTVIDSASNTVRTLLGAGDHPIGLAVAQSGDIFISHQTTPTTVLNRAGVIRGEIEGYDVTGLSADGRRGVGVRTTGAHSSSIGVIDTETDAIIARVSIPELANSAIFGSDGSTIYPAQESGLTLIDGRTYVDKNSISLDEIPYSLKAAPGDAQIYVTNQLPGTLTIISPNDGKVIGSVAVGKHPQALAVTDSGRKIYVANHGEDAVQ